MPVNCNTQAPHSSVKCRKLKVYAQWKLNVSTSKIMQVQMSLSAACFWQILWSMGWLVANGRPRVLRVGATGHAMNFHTDHLFMIFLQQLCFPISWNDMMHIMGGSCSTLLLAYNWTLQYVHYKYAPLMQDITVWKDKIKEFSGRLCKVLDGTL